MKRDRGTWPVRKKLSSLPWYKQVCVHSVPIIHSTTITTTSHDNTQQIQQNHRVPIDQWVPLSAATRLDRRLAAKGERRKWFRTTASTLEITTCRDVTVRCYRRGGGRGWGGEGERRATIASTRSLSLSLSFSLLSLLPLLFWMILFYFIIIIIIETSLQ